MGTIILWTKEPFEIQDADARSAATQAHLRRGSEAVILSDRTLIYRSIGYINLGVARLCASVLPGLFDSPILQCQKLPHGCHAISRRI